MLSTRKLPNYPSLVKSCDLEENLTTATLLDKIIPNNILKHNIIATNMCSSKPTENKFLLTKNYN